jgi:hypothetical protein
MGLDEGGGGKEVGTRGGGGGGRGRAMVRSLCRFHCVNYNQTS